jgi:hypothetical protein
MCVAQISSWQDETLAMIRKAQSKGLVLVAITYDEEVLAEEGAWIIDTVQVQAQGMGPHPMSALDARERIGEWLWKQSPVYRQPLAIGRGL